MEEWARIMCRIYQPENPGEHKHGQYKGNRNVPADDASPHQECGANEQGNGVWTIDAL